MTEDEARTNWTPPAIDKLAAALAKAQAEFPSVPRSGRNPHLKNEYATLDDIIGAIRGPLGKHGLSFVQLLGSNGGTTLRTILMHESGQFLESTVAVDVGEQRGINALQALGSSITYMKRYALGALLGISTDADTDGEGSKAKAIQPKRQPERQQSEEQPPSNRPLDGPTVQTVIRKKAGWQGNLRTEGEPITEGQVRGVGGLLADAVKVDGMNQALMDKARHDILAYLVGVNETRKLTKAEASAIIAWLKVDGDGWDLNEYARREVQAVMVQIAEDAGQQKMDL